MGAIHFSMDLNLAELLARELGISAFVETGTFKGDSVALVRSIFSEIHTCELSSELHLAALHRFKADKTVTCHFGSAGDLLKRIARQLAQRPVLYWLDAHWCAGENTAGEESQCSLLEELDAVYPLHPNSVVWIDDARYFMSPPPKPLKTQGWPTCDQVLRTLIMLGSSTHLITFYNDTILLYPKSIYNVINQFIYSNGCDWLNICHSANVLLPQTKAELERYKNKRNPFRNLIRNLNRLFNK